MPDSGWSKLPHSLIEALPIIDTLGELKVILYVLRHTWGYQEFDISKRFTWDELQHGRKRRDKSRMDKGTGLSINTVKKGADRAVEHGFLEKVWEHNRDGGRRSYVYRLNMSGPDTRGSDFDPLAAKDCSPHRQTLPPRVPEPAPRSEKETKERNNEKKQEEQAAAPVMCSTHKVPMKRRTKDGEVWYSHRLEDGRWCKGAPGDQPGDTNRQSNRRHNVANKTVRCPSCSLTRAADWICPDCGMCYACCTCDDAESEIHGSKPQT